jgi:hypothetical protein
MARIAVVAFIIATAAPLSGVSATQASELDLPAALLAPDDVEQAGFDDYGVWAGWSLSDEDQMRVFEGGGMSEDDAREAVETSGVRTTYFQTLLPIDEHRASDTFAEPTVLIQTIMREFDTAANAGDDFEAAHGAPDYHDGEFLDDVPTFGDESFVVRIQRDAGVDGSTYPLDIANVVFRSANVVTIVILTGVDNAISLEDALDLADIAAEKVDGLLDGDDVGSIPAPNLGFYTPQYDEDGMCVCRSVYTMYDGEARPLTADSVRTDGLQYLIDYFGVESQYLSIVKPVEPEESGVAMLLRVSSFATDDEANFYVGDAIDWLEDGVSDYSDVVAFEPEDLSDLGDRSAAMTFVTGGDPTFTQVEDPVELTGAKLLVQVDTIVYEIDLFGVETPDLETLETMAESMIACAEGGCTEQVAFPNEVSDVLADQANLAA